MKTGLILHPHISAIEQQRNDTLNRALTTDPASGQRWFELAQSYRRLGHFQLAIAAFDKATQLNYEAEQARLIIAVLRQQYAATQQTPIKPCPFQLFDDFLSVSETALIWAMYNAVASLQHNAKVEGNIRDATRRSATTLGINGYSSLDFFRHRITAVLTASYSYFNIQPPQNTHLAIQLSSHGHGDFYGIHNDTGRRHDRRRLSFVYYFHRQPRAFTGGELLLFDARGGDDHQYSSFCGIEPINNRLVVFPSDYFHQVCRVRLNSEDRSLGRHTLNGWLSEPSSYDSD